MKTTQRSIRPLLMLATAAGLALVTASAHADRCVTQETFNRLRQQPTCDKRQGQRRRVIQPLCVIDHTQQRTLLGRLRE